MDKDQEGFNVFGEWLSSQLAAKRMTAGELHQRSRLSRAAIYHFLRGNRVPDDSSLSSIAVALEVEVSSVPKFPRKKVGRPSVDKGKVAQSA